MPGMVGHPRSLTFAWWGVKDNSLFRSLIQAAALKEFHFDDTSVYFICLETRKALQSEGTRFGSQSTTAELARHTQMLFDWENCQ
jgi:hypothetical protein